MDLGLAVILYRYISKRLHLVAQNLLSLLVLLHHEVLEELCQRNPRTLQLHNDMERSGVEHRITFLVAKISFRSTLLE